MQLTRLQDFHSRLLNAVHGVPVTAIERANGSRSILETIHELAREELRVLQALWNDAPNFDVATEELRALRKMVLRRIGTSPAVDALVEFQEERLPEIEKRKRAQGLTATERPDVSRAQSSRRDAVPVRTPGAGIEIRDLWRDGERRALHVTMPSGSRWPALDYHIPGPEEVYVISGDLDDGPVSYTEGAFIHYPAGSSHMPSTRTGCSLFVFYPEG